MGLAIRPSVFDARQPNRDPTGTSKLRAAFRADAKLRLRQLRAQMRVAVIDQDILGLSHGAIMRFHPADVRLNALHAWLDSMAGHYLTGPWPDKFIDQAWESGRQVAQTEVAHQAVNSTSANHLAQLARQELQGIAAATVQQVSRAAADVLMRQLKAPRAWQVLSRTFDKVASNRLNAMCNVLTVAGHNQAKIETYRAAGLARVGIIPETTTKNRRGAASDSSLPYHTAPRRAQPGPTSPGLTTPGQKHSDASIDRAELEIEFIPAKWAEGLVGVLTAGDDLVCERCQDSADDSPYTLDEALNLLPLHPNCRCSVYAWTGATQDAAPRRPVVHDRSNLYFADFEPAQWAEELHPRQWHGRFATKGKESPYARWYRAHPTPQEPTGPAQQELWPGKFPPIPDPKKAVDVPDFDKAHVELDRTTKGDKEKTAKFLKQWNERVGEAPEEFQKEFLGGMKGSMRLEYDDYGNRLTITGNLLGASDRSIAQYTREIDFNNNTAESAYFSITGSQQGKDIGKKMLAANVAMYQKLGLDQVEVHANIDVGGYAWAKYGYVPSDRSWDDLRNTLRDRIGGGGSFEPSSWDELSDSQQNDIERAWQRATFDDFYESDQENWRDGGGDLAEAKKQLADKFDGDANKEAKWLYEEAKKFAITVGEGADIKGQMLGPLMSEKGLSVESLINYTTIDYEDRRGDGEEDPDITVDWDKVDDGKLTADQREQIESVLVEAFNKRANYERGFVDPPEWLTENVESSQGEYWSSMRERDRFRWASDNGELPETREDGEGDLGAISDDDREMLTSLVDDSDPKAIWEIADSKYGKDLLLGTDWNGALDLNDSDSMRRFGAYVAPKKK